MMDDWVKMMATIDHHIGVAFFFKIDTSRVHASPDAAIFCLNFP